MPTQDARGAPAPIGADSDWHESVELSIVASHLFYPVLFYDMFTQSKVVVALLVIRNVLLAAAGIVAARAALDSARSRDPALPDTDADLLRPLPLNTVALRLFATPLTTTGTP